MHNVVLVKIVSLDFIWTSFTYKSVLFDCTFLVVLWNCLFYCFYDSLETFCCLNVQIKWIGLKSCFIRLRDKMRLESSEQEMKYLILMWIKLKRRRSCFKRSTLRRPLVAVQSVTFANVSLSPGCPVITLFVRRWKPRTSQQICKCLIHKANCVLRNPINTAESLYPTHSETRFNKKYCLPNGGQRNESVDQKSLSLNNQIKAPWLRATSGSYKSWKFLSGSSFSFLSQKLPVFFSVTQ